MAAWGLLKGLGEGLSYSGAQMLKTQEEIAKEARLEKYRQAQVADERQYTEGQNRLKVAKEVESIENGRARGQNINVYGEPVGPSVDKGVTKSQNRPISTRPGGIIYNPDDGSVVQMPGEYRAGKSGKAPVVKNVKDSNGNDVLVRVNPDGSVEPITLGDAKAGPKGALPPVTKDRFEAATTHAKYLTKLAETSELTPDQEAALAAANQVIQDAYNPPPPGTERNPLIGVTAEDIPKLRPGTIVVDPEGNLRRVPDRQEVAPEAPASTAAAAAPAASAQAATGAAPPEVKAPNGLLQPDFKLPQPTFNVGVQGDKAKAAYRKEVDKITSAVKERVKYEGLPQVPEEQLRMALSGNLSAKERAAVVKELTRRGAK